MSAPHFEHTDAVCCTICRSENVTHTDELIPSGLRFKIQCDNGHVTNGIPVHRNTARA